MNTSAANSTEPDAGGIVPGPFSIGWCWRMAWRDSRASRRRLLLFSTSIVLGIAALAAIGSLGQNMKWAVEEQARSLLGADLSLSSREPFTADAEKIIQKIGGRQARETQISTMIYFNSSGKTRLVQLRAVGDGYPFYGRLESIPKEASDEFRSGGALVESTLLGQFNATAGDTIKLGGLTTKIAGELKNVPGEALAMSTVAPRVYLPMSQLDATELLRKGSFADYKVYFKFDDGVDVSNVVAQFKPELDTLRIRHETVEDRKRELGRALENLNHFLNLVGFVALLLGGVGVASAIHAHVKQKLATVALLRCLGASVAQTFTIYLLQGMALGLVGSVAGAALGLAVQTAMPNVLKEFLPFEFAVKIYWPALLRAIGVGFGICFLFALLPLLPLRRISPLAAIRASYEPERKRFDVLQWLAYLALAMGVGGFALSQMGRVKFAAGFTAGLVLAFAVIAAVAGALIFLTRKFTLAALPFVVRQGLANLHRPNNRTLLLMLSLGLGTMLMLGLHLVQRTILTQLIATTGAMQPNTLFFDIQSDQVEGMTSLMQSNHLPVIDESAIITMRLTGVKDRTVDSILADKTNRQARWALRREYRSTYSDHLRDSEKIISGEWRASVGNETNDVPISVEDGLAKELKVGLNDRLVFDVEGLSVTTRVASLRSVDWRRIQPNFFIVFPKGVLEDAPAMHVLVTHASSDEECARIQGEVVRNFPNVSSIDLRMVLRSVDSIVGKISKAVTFMALFTVLTGLMVLAGALVTGRYQRIQESILLRTLGASQSQVIRVLLVEYFALGALAAATGVLLAQLAAWGLCHYVFELKFVPEIWPSIEALLVVPGLTIAMGFLMSRGVLNHPPLAILRESQ